MSFYAPWDCHLLRTHEIDRTSGVNQPALRAVGSVINVTIDFVEETLFTRITQILNEETKQLARCKKILSLYLIFCERNPGITRILGGDALMGEHERLRERVSQVYDRIETQLRQCLRMAEMEEGWRTAIPVNPAANMLLATAEGRIAQFVRSNFAQSPTEGWDDQWRIATSAIGIEVPKGS